MIDIFSIFALQSGYGFCIVMSKKCLIISTSTELVRIAPENIVYFKADGNYCYMQADNDATKPPPVNKEIEIKKEEKEEKDSDKNSRRQIYFQLGYVENLIEKQLGAEGLRFIRIGRSLIINRDYIYFIHTQKQQLLLVDSKRKLYQLEASKDQLKQLKEALERELEEELKKEQEENNGNQHKTHFFLKKTD